MKITVIIDGQEKEIELSDEQIIAIGQKYFELVSPKIELKPIDVDKSKDSILTRPIIEVKPIAN